MPSDRASPSVHRFAAFPTAVRRKVQPFGSYVHGVSLPGADLDVVCTGLMTPIARGGGDPTELPATLLQQSHVLSARRRKLSDAFAA
jgi:hypothetical protein